MRVFDEVGLDSTTSKSLFIFFGGGVKITRGNICKNHEKIKLPVYFEPESSRLYELFAG